MGVLPTRKTLADAVIQVLGQASEPMKACDVNDKVAALLHIPQDVLEIEDSNCTGTEFAYQMRWIRTNLKNKGLISSPKRGFWVFQNNSSK